MPELYNQLREYAYFSTLYRGQTTIGWSLFLSPHKRRVSRLLSWVMQPIAFFLFKLYFSQTNKKWNIANWTKGITELVYEQITNQLSASSDLITAAILSKSAQPTRKALCSVGILNRKDFEINRFIEFPKTLSTLMHKCKVSKLKKR